MKQKRLLSLVLSVMCGMALMAQEVPTAELLDVQFNADGTAVDLSPMHNAVNFYGNAESTTISFSTAFNRYVPSFNNEWSKTASGYYRIDFEENQEFRDKLADGHSLEIVVKANYEGTIQNVEAKPFSAMQSGGTGFLICTQSASGSGGKNVFTFLPNVTTTGASTWRWCTSGVTPVSGFYYHVIGVWNKEEQKAYVYVDGELKNTIDAPGELRFANAGCNWFCVGGDADPNSGGQSWNGDVVIARVYDKALTGDEATALWKAVEKQEKEANNFVYTEAVAEGRSYIENDFVATQSMIDEYQDALDALSALVQEGTTEELEAQYDVVKGIRAQLETSAAAYANYKTHADAAIAYLTEDTSFEGVDRDYIEAYLDNYIEPNEEYPNGSYLYIWDNHSLTTEEIAAEANWVDEKLRVAIENGYKPGSDITNLLTNASFANGFNGWSGTVGTSVIKSTNESGYYGAETWARGFDMYQTISGLENGVYVLTVTAGYRPFNDRYSTYYAANMYLNENRLFFPTVYESRIPVEEAVDGENCYLTQVGSDASVDLDISEEGGTDVVAYAMHGCTSVANAAAGGRAVNYLIAKVTDGTLTVGFCNPNPNASTDWTGLANIHLLYAGTLEDAAHYIDETLACMVARAEGIINFTPDVGDYSKAPNCPQAIKVKLQAAIDAAAAAATVEDKYALVGTFTSLWDEYMTGRAAYVAMIDEAETCLSIVSDMYSAGKFSDEDRDAAEASIADIWDSFESGEYTTEQALALDGLRSKGLIPEVDENGTYQIKSNYDMAYYCLKAGTVASPINGKLLTDIDYFTENQMMENFYGTLDGNYHTITVNITRAARGAALINNMQNGSCVKNMTIKGEVYNSDKFVTAVAANSYNVCSISGIVSLINGHSTCVGDSGNGGVMSCNRGSMTMKDCVFAGTLEGNDAINSSGVVGWTNGVTVIENCLQIGDITLNAEGSRTFARIPESVILNNCYYKTAFGAEEGIQITDEQLASGEVCYRLNKGNTENPTWFQNIGEDPFPVPNPNHQKVGKKADGTYTNDESQFITPEPQDNTLKADLFDIVFNEDGTADDVSPMHSDVILYGDAPTIYYSETYQRNVATFDNPWGGVATTFYKGLDYNDDGEVRAKFANGHSLEVLCMPNYEGTIPNSEAKPFSAMQSGGTGFLISTISGARQNELTFLPNISTAGTNTWRWATSGVVPESNKFYHVVGVWNPETGKAYVYINGELMNTVDAPGVWRPATSSCNWLCVGADPSGASTAHGSWHGDVAIARAYGKPLTDAEVALLWKRVQDPSSVDPGETHSGTKEDPFVVRTAADLTGLSKLFVPGRMNYVVMENDIDMATVTDWKPLFNYSHATDDYPYPFIDFDGKNHVIRNLTSNLTGAYDYCGLFGVLCGNVRNLGVENANVTCTGGTGILGGYLGHSKYGQPCYVENVWVTGKLSASGYCGGMFGNVADESHIKNCYANVEVTGETDLTGGIIGRVRGKVDMQNVYAAGSVNRGGGIIGGGFQDATAAGTYTNVAVWNNTVQNFGPAREADALNGILYYDGSNFAALQSAVVAWDPQVWFCDMAEGSYPVLKAFTTGINRVMQSNGSVIFTINGIRVEKTKQGIYIIDGKKILVK